MKHERIGGINIVIYSILDNSNTYFHITNGNCKYPHY